MKLSTFTPWSLASLGLAVLGAGMAVASDGIGLIEVETSSSQHRNQPKPPASDDVVPVKVEKRPDGTFALLRGGSPYFIKGAGGSEFTDELRQAGGNSFRTWGADELERLLLRASSRKMTVAAGIWLGHTRHGFRYDDEAAVRRQFESTRAVIRRHKDHPAVLIWGLGNEMEGDGNDPKVWRAINDLAKMAHLEDPNHPTMTVIAELGKDNVKLAMFREYCPDVDILGVNSYGGAGSVGERLTKAKFDKPFILTEFGPRGFWEGPKTAWGAPIEPNSTEKADTYKDSYAKGVVGNPGRCLGSYAFFWGQKQEVTSTWFSLFPSAQKTESVDALTEAWKGERPESRCPRIKIARFDDADKPLLPGSEHKLTFEVDDPDHDQLGIHLEIRMESDSHHEGGDREAVPRLVSEKRDIRFEDHSFIIRVPQTPGAYRVYCEASTSRNNEAATANFPFLVIKP